MSDDLDLAALLGEAPKTPDPGFRFDVLSLTSQRAHRRSSRHRAFRVVLFSTLVGLIFPLAHMLGLGLAELQPLLLVAGILALAYVLALLVTHGPRAVFARPVMVLRTSLLRR